MTQQSGAVRLPDWLNLRDIVLLGTIVFGGGTIWQQVQALHTDVEQLKAAVQVNADRGQDGRTGTAERLARIEARLDVIQDQLRELKRAPH